MVSKLLCCVSSCAAFTFCFLPHEWDADIDGIPMRWCMIGITGCPVVLHMYHFVFDDAFLYNFHVIRPWFTPLLIAFVCNTHLWRTRLLVIFTTAILSQCGNVFLTIAAGLWMLNAIDHTSTLIFIIMTLDRFIAKWSLPLTIMWTRQVMEFYIFFAITASADEATKSQLLKEQT